MIENFGTIESTAAGAAARSLQAVAETPGALGENVFFSNEIGARVNGNVNLVGTGNQTVELFSGSVINGAPTGPSGPLFALSAGTGFNTLILNGVSDATLSEMGFSSVPTKAANQSRISASSALGGVTTSWK